jgi:heat shock protein HslJ
MLFRTILAALSLLRFTPVLPADFHIVNHIAEDKNRWVLVEMYGEPVVKTDDIQQEIFLVMDQTTMRYEGFAGCNQILGAFETAGQNEFHFTSISTARCDCNCPNEISALLEGVIAETMTRVDRYEQKENQLVFYVGEVPVMTFELRNNNYQYVTDVHRL